MTRSHPPVTRDLPGFVAAHGADAGAAAHLGNPVAEQRRLATGDAVADLGGRAVLTVTGEDRLTWLHSLTTQDLRALAPGQSAETLVLDPNGRVEHALHLVDDGATTWVVTEGASGEPLRAWLDSMRFMLRVEVADVSDRYVVVGEASASPEADGAVAVWVDPWPGPVGQTRAYAELDVDRTWREVVYPRAAVTEALAGRDWAGAWAAEALRVAAVRPRAATEVDERTIPHELDWLRTAVHLSKGCYRGQETVARVVNLGRPPRRIVLLQLDGSGHELPEPGAPVTVGERQVGRITSAVAHHEEGPMALAVVKTSADLAAGVTTVDPSGGVVSASPDARQDGSGFAARAERPRLG